jgi:hypothetical protein
MFDFTLPQRRFHRLFALLFVSDLRVWLVANGPPRAYEGRSRRVEVHQVYYLRTDSHECRVENSCSCISVCARNIVQTLHACSAKQIVTFSGKQINEWCHTLATVVVHCGELVRTGAPVPLPGACMYDA